MAVHHLSLRDPAAPYARRARVGDPMWIGLVLRVETQTERIMSDVWADVTTAVVWDPAKGAPSNVHIGDSEFGAEKVAEVDATADVVAAHDAWEAAREAERVAAEEARREADAKARLHEVQRGCRAVVARGRKVAKGTEGRVFWIGQGGFGPRAGLETDDGQTVWIALSNLDRVLPPKPEGMSWRAFAAYIAELQAEAAEAA
jgi:hypothetical protein